MPFQYLKIHQSLNFQLITLWSWYWANHLYGLGPDIKEDQTEVVDIHIAQENLVFLLDELDIDHDIMVPPELNFEL